MYLEHFTAAHCLDFAADARTDVHFHLPLLIQKYKIPIKEKINANINYFEQDD